jgi:hypothetical protein
MSDKKYLVLPFRSVSLRSRFSTGARPHSERSSALRSYGAYRRKSR